MGLSYRSLDHLWVAAFGRKADFLIATRTAPANDSSGRLAGRSLIKSPDSQTSQAPELVFRPSPVHDAVSHSFFGGEMPLRGSGELYPLAQAGHLALESGSEQVACCLWDAVLQRPTRRQPLGC